MRNTSDALGIKHAMHEAGTLPESGSSGGKLPASIDEKVRPIRPSITHAHPHASSNLRSNIDAFALAGRVQ